MKLQEQFTINDTTIDLGTDGRFKPGSENRLYQKLKGRKDGPDVFARLVKMKAILLKESEAVAETKGVEDSAEKKPKAQKGSSNSGQSDKKDGSDDEPKGETKDEKVDDKDDGDKQPEYEPTGQFEVKHFGGGRYETIDPKGFVIGELKGKPNAEAWLEEKNS